MFIGRLKRETAPMGGANHGIRKIFWLLPSGEAKQAGDQAGER